MSTGYSTLTKDLAGRITRSAEENGLLIRDRARIRELALHDPLTLDARGTKDVLNRYGSPSFITRTTSRSAPMTEIFFGEPNEQQARTIAAAASYATDSGVRLLLMDKMMGMHPEHRHRCRMIVTHDHARLLLLWDKLIFDLPPELEAGEPDQVQIMIPEWGAIARGLGLPPVSILVDAVNRVTFALGSDYFGEVKKGHLRMAMYAEKLRYLHGEGGSRGGEPGGSDGDSRGGGDGGGGSGGRSLDGRNSSDGGGHPGGLGVHAGGKVIRAKNAASDELEDKGALFFGLSGTGKTTLSVHHFWLDPNEGERVTIRQDDFFVMTEDGRAFGTEDNAYIKTEGLEAESQPLLYAGATSPHAALENAYVDPKTLDVDFFRYDHPFAPGGKCYNGRGIVVRRELDFTDERIDLDRVDHVYFITRRETIVPPVARLNTEQAAAFFMLGESIITSAADPTKAGLSVREVGTNPFIVGSKGEEGNIFYRILKANPHMQCFLLNTGGFGGRDVDRATEKLDAPGGLDKLRGYLDGKRHEDVGKLYELELRDGGREKFKLAFVRYELFRNFKRVRSRSNLKAVVEGIETGHYSGAGIELIEVGVMNGRKIKIQESAAIIREIARGRVEWKRDEYWGYEIPAAIPGLDLHRFDPRRYYSDAEINILDSTLRAERATWLASFGDLDPAIARAIG